MAVDLLNLGLVKRCHPRNDINDPWLHRGAALVEGLAGFTKMHVTFVSLSWMARFLS